MYLYIPYFGKWEHREQKENVLLLVRLLNTIPLSVRYSYLCLHNYFYFYRNLYWRRTMQKTLIRPRCTRYLYWYMYLVVVKVLLVPQRNKYWKRFCLFVSTMYSVVLVRVCFSGRSPSSPGVYRYYFYLCQKDDTTKWEHSICNRASMKVPVHVRVLVQ